MPGEVDEKGKGKSPFLVSEQRKQAIVRQNSVIVGARAAWIKMKATYNQSLLRRTWFGGS